MNWSNGRNLNINIFYSGIDSSSAFPIRVNAICNGCHSLHLQDKRCAFFQYEVFAFWWNELDNLRFLSVSDRHLKVHFDLYRSMKRAQHPHSTAYLSHSIVTIYQFQNAVIAYNWQITLKCHRNEWEIYAKKKAHTYTRTKWDKAPAQWQSVTVTLTKVYSNMQWIAATKLLLGTYRKPEWKRENRTVV